MAITLSLGIYLVIYFVASKVTKLMRNDYEMRVKSAANKAHRSQLLQ